MSKWHSWLIAWALPAVLVALHNKQTPYQEQPQQTHTFGAAGPSVPESDFGGVRWLRDPSCAEAWGQLPEADGIWLQSRTMMWSPRIKTAEDYYVDPMVKVPRKHSDRVCPTYNFVTASKATGFSNFTYTSLVVDAIPKAASKLIRESLMPALSPNFTAGCGKNWVSCGALWKQMSHDEVKFGLRLSFVRHPLRRFLSGLTEVAGNHYTHYERWRHDHGKGNVTVPGTPATMRDFLVDYLVDMKDGYRNDHTRTMTNYLFANRYMRPPNYIVKLERANAGWKEVRKLLNMDDSKGPRRFPAPTATSREEDEFQAALRDAFDDQAWALFCDFFYQDFKCFGYTAPAQCREQWDTRRPAERSDDRSDDDSRLTLKSTGHVDHEE